MNSVRMKENESGRETETERRARSSGLRGDRTREKERGAKKKSDGDEENIYIMG